MKKLILVIIIFNSMILSAQKELKGGKLSDKLDLINLLLETNQYELAIHNFENKDTVILKKNVKKSDIQKYTSISESISEIKSIYSTIDSLLFNWKLLQNEKEYEKLSLNFIELDEHFLLQSRISDYNDIKSFTSVWNKKYLELKEKYLSTPNEIIAINPSNYEDAVKLLKRLNVCLANFDNLSDIDSKSVILLQNAKESQLRLNNKKGELEKYIQSNKPITLTQINSLLTNKTITVEQIKKYFTEIDYQFSKYYVTINVNGEIQRLESYEFINLLNLDVVGYFNLYDKYNTELKQKLFKQTEEYKQLLQKLKSKQNQIINSYLYMSIYWGSSEGNYNLKTKTFNFRNTKNDGYHFGYNSGYLQFNDICIKKPSNIPLIESRKDFGYGSFMEQIYQIPVNDEKLALFIEENKESISLMFILKFEGIETKRNEIFETDYLKTLVKNIIVYDRKSEKIIINYSY